MTIQHRIAGIALVALGLYVAIYSFTKLDVGIIGKPGSGFFTLVCGSGIAILSAIWLVAGLMGKVDPTPFWEEKGQWLKPVLGVVLVFVYAGLMVPLGYVLATALFIVLWQVVVERGKLLTIVLFTVLGTGAMYVLFEVLLSVPLPNGPLGI